MVKKSKRKSKKKLIPKIIIWLVITALIIGSILLFISLKDSPDNNQLQNPGSSSSSGATIPHSGGLLISRGDAGTGSSSSGAPSE